MTDPKVFPIQDYRPIPWGLIAPHEAQAVKNHGGQTLQRLAERGGLSPCEALCAIRGDGIGRLLREPHGLRRDKQTGETICRCTCMHELDDIVRKHRRESSAPSELERLRDALRLAETTRNAAQEVATRETERARLGREIADRWHTALCHAHHALGARDNESTVDAARRLSAEVDQLRAMREQLVDVVENERIKRHTVMDGDAYARGKADGYRWCAEEILRRLRERTGR